MNNKNKKTSRERNIRNKADNKKIKVLSYKMLFYAESFRHIENE